MNTLRETNKPGKSASHVLFQHDWNLNVTIGIEQYENNKIKVRLNAAKTSIQE